MTVNFKLPALGENVDSGDVVAILVQEGDQLGRNDPILELETDKATVEVPSDVEGRILRIHVSKGDRVEVGQVILSVESTEESLLESQEAASPAQPAVAPIGKTKDFQGSGVVEFEVPPATEKPVEQAVVRPEAEKKSPSRIVPASPAVRRFAREIGIDVTRVPGSGVRGRISIDDVKKFSKQLNARRAAPRSVAAVPAAAIPLPDFSRFGDVEIEPFSNVRRKTAEHVDGAWQIPHVTHHDRADITELEQLRKRHSERVQKAGGKLTVTAIALKVVVTALKLFPKFNASIDVVGEQIIYKKYFNVGVAVDTPRGLLVPVIRDVDRKNIVELSVELSDVAERARKAKIGPDDLQGGCFTITNLGGIGGTSFTPIINAPEAAILGIARATVEGVYRENNLEPRLMMPLCLSYDHRLIDGADAARFLRWVAQAFEDPLLMLLEG